MLAVGVDGIVGPQTRGALGGGGSNTSTSNNNSGPKPSQGVTIAVQKKLGLSADGAYGPITRSAVKAFQARNGLIPIRGDLMPEVAAGITRMFDARLSPRSSTGFMTDEEAAHFDASGEQRTTDQQRHDVLAAIVETAARSGEHPSIGGAAPRKCRRTHSERFAGDV